MGNTYGYWIDLQGMTFADDEGTWLQAFPLGNYEHPVFGKINITPQRVQRFAANVRNRVRGQDLDIDYDHKADTKVAAGWVSDAQARPDGLYIKVNWTPTARQRLQDGEYRYFSPEFVDEWEHPKTGQVHKDVLFGGALTNRPFLKDILPINLSEMVGDIMGDTKTGAGGTPPTDAENMTGLAKLLGLSGQVTSADILQAAATKLTEGQGQQNNNGSNQGGQGQQNFSLNIPAPQAPQTVQLGDQVFQLVPAAPQNNGGQGNGGQNGGGQQNAGQGSGQQGLGQVNYGSILQQVQLDENLQGDPKALADVVRAQNEKIGMLAAAHKLAEAEAFIVKAGDGVTALSPAVRELALELLVKAPTALSETVYKLLGCVAEGKATVVLGELGRQRTSDGSSAIKQFSDAVARLRKEDDKLTFADAADQISRTDPGLANAYRQATMAGEVE